MDGVPQEPQSLPHCVVIEQEKRSTLKIKSWWWHGNERTRFWIEIRATYGRWQYCNTSFSVFELHESHVTGNVKYAKQCYGIDTPRLSSHSNWSCGEPIEYLPLTIVAPAPVIGHSAKQNMREHTRRGHHCHHENWLSLLLLPTLLLSLSALCRRAILMADCGVSRNDAAMQIALIHETFRLRSRRNRGRT